MATAAGPAIACTKTFHRDFTGDLLIDDAFRSTMTAHLAHADTRRGKQIVDMPVQFLCPCQMTTHPRLQIAQRTSGIGVESGWKVKGAQAADTHTYRRCHLDQQLVGLRCRRPISRHKMDCCGVRCRSSTSARGRE